MKRSLLLICIASLILSGCASVRENRDYCITAGAIAGALAGGAAEDDNETEAALGGAVVGGAIAWFVCRSDADGDGVLDDKDRCPMTSKGVKVNDRGCELDADGDGVTDSNDMCPNTPRGASVDAKGCALDSDRDGVADHMDSCPNTKKGASVDSTGCELDSDGDGVADSSDNCPTTKAGKSVDNKGCHIMFTLTGVNFDYDSADLTDMAKGKLDQAVATLKRQSNLEVRIDGHTDSVGSADYNQGLSERRAMAVRDYLISEGINAGRLTSAGMGESKPVASNDTDAGRAQNRRVEFAVTDN